LKQGGFRVENKARREDLPMALLPCLRSPDPELRDDIAFSAYSSWMRAGQLDADQLRTLRAALYLELDAVDPQGVAQPFAALVLSEIARTDRVTTWMTPAERDEMVRRAVAWFTGVRDYRGLDPMEGWRHGVAHGSDWLLQLALNPALDQDALQLMLDAVALQAVPDTGHAYVFGEPERLARPVLYIAARRLITESAWNAWFDALLARLGTAPEGPPDGSWLARRHDLDAFLSALYVNADLARDPGMNELKPRVTTALKRLP
jgi:hypothetical protein